jgi:hypothetical protein
VSRRVSRLRTEPPDRQPVLVVGALVIGVVAGIVMIPRLFSGMDSRTENYVLLASSLYAQGESPAMLRDRLTSVGIQQPASVVLGMAQRYAASRDKKQQHDAEALEAFGKVLLNPGAASPTPSAAGDAAPTPAATASPGGTAQRPSGTPGVGPTGTPPAGGAATPAAGATGTPPVVASGTPGAAGVPAATPTPATGAPAAVQRGRVKPSDGGSARLRKDPSQTGGTLAIIPYAAQVEILETVRGQAVGPEGDTRWLRVRYGNLVGYLWSQLVTVGD